MKEYQVVDLSDFYEDCPVNYVFLVVYDVPKIIEEREIRRVKISEGRNVDTIYPKGEKILVVIRDYETGAISVHEPRMFRGIYRVDEVIENKFGWFEPISNYEFNEVKRTIFCQGFKKIIYADNVIVVSSKYSINIYLRNRLVENTRIHIDTISLQGGIANIKDELIEKSLSDSEIAVADLIGYMDDLVDDQSVYISFDSMNVLISSKIFMITKKMSTDDINESFSCNLSVKRVGIASIVFSKIIKAEDEKELLKFLNEFFLM